MHTECAQADLSEITHLLSLPELRCLWLSNNPIADEDNYRLTVLRTLPGLTKLDDKVVTNEEREAALISGVDFWAAGAELTEGGADTEVDAEAEAEPEPEPGAQPRILPRTPVSQPAPAMPAEAVPPAPVASGDIKVGHYLPFPLLSLPLRSAVFDLLIVGTGKLTHAAFGITVYTCSTKPSWTQ